MFKRKIKIREKDKPQIIISQQSKKKQPRDSITIEESPFTSVFSFFKRHKTLLLIGLFFVLFSGTILALLFSKSPSKPPVPPDQHAILETRLDEPLVVKDFIFNHFRNETLARSAQAKAKKLGVDALPASTKVLSYYERITDPYPYQLRCFFDQQHSIRFLFGDSLQVDLFSNQLIKTYLADQWVLKDNMLELMTQKDTTKLGIPWDILVQIEKILSWSVGLKNLQKNDTIYWVREAQKYEGDPNFQKKDIVGLLLNARSLDTTLIAIQFEKDLEKAFYDREGRPWQRQFLRSPVKYGRISSRYNLIRLHPILKDIKPHQGTDYAAPEGTEIYALADGVIVKRGNYGANGNYIKIQHDSIYATGYLHMSRFEPSVQLNDTVAQGQIIGYVGSTGSSTGPHVCLRFWRRTFQDDFVQAFPYLPKPPSLPYSERLAYFAKRDSIIASIKLLDR